MSIRTIELTSELDDFIAGEIERGGFQTADPVIDTALQMLRQYREKASAVDAAIDAGETSGLAEGDVFGRIAAARDAREAAGRMAAKVA